MRWIFYLLLAICSSASADEWKFELAQEPTFSLVQPDPLISRRADKPDEYVVMFTAEWCGPCQIWKKSQNRKTIEAKYGPTVLVDMDKNPEWNKARGNFAAVDRYPTFWLVRRSNMTSKPIKVWIGGLSLSDIEAALKITLAPQSKYERRSKLRWSLNGSLNPDKKMLVEHIKEEHNIDIDETIYSYDELLAIHDDLHNNVYVLK